MEMDDTAGLAEAAGSRFSSRELIGKGSFGDVYKAFDKELDKEVAIKVIDLEESEDEIDDIQKEISMLSQCRSPYITEYYASYLHQTKLWIVMEYIAGGSVADLLQIGPPLDETSIACILRDLLHAVEYLHNEGKIHRDIKAANILLTENGDVKVADFGVSAQLTRTISRRKTLVGTPFWIAPEVIQNSDGYNEKADIWSLGITTTEMAKWELPLTDLPPMRVLFIIPQENPPQRASAKELLKHRFIRNARKSPRLLERIRERPKYQIKEDADTIRNGPRAIGEGSDIVKVAGNPREETVRASNQGKTMKNAGWDFNIDGSQTTGTVKSAPKPPQARERKPEVPYNQTTRRVSESGSQQSPAFGNVPADLLVKDARHQETNHEDLRLCDNRKESPISGSGTVVVRSLKGSQLSSQYHDQSSLLSSTYASFEDASLSGTFVLHNQHDDHESPRTPKSRLGIQEKASSASIEDSAMNFAEAKAAIRAGFRKGNPRERSALGKLNNDGPDNRRVGKMTTSSVSPRSLPRSHQPSDDEENAKVKLSCAPLSLLLIPSLKEAVSDDPEGSLACAVANSLTIMERSNPGSYEVLISRLLQRSSSSKESSLKDLNELVVQLYARGKVASKEKVESDNEKRQQQNEFHSNTNLSPLARCLLSRWQGQVSRYLNPI